MRLCYQEFKDACERMIRNSEQEFDLETIWRTLDDDSSGYITLREFDKEAHESLCAFKRWATAKHKSVCRAFNRLDKNGTGQLKLKDLQSATHPVLSLHATSVVFEGLDKNGRGNLELQHVRFLDDWDLDHHDTSKSPRSSLVLHEGQLPKGALRARHDRVDTNLYLESKVRQVFSALDADANGEID